MSPTFPLGLPLSRPPRWIPLCAWTPPPRTPKIPPSGRDGDCAERTDVEVPLLDDARRRHVTEGVPGADLHLGARVPDGTVEDGARDGDVNLGPVRHVVPCRPGGPMLYANPPRSCLLLLSLSLHFSLSTQPSYPSFSPYPTPPLTYFSTPLSVLRSLPETRPRSPSTRYFWVSHFIVSLPPLPLFSLSLYLPFCVFTSLFYSLCLCLCLNPVPLCFCLCVVPFSASTPPCL